MEIYFGLFILGIFFGSFLNALADRLSTENTMLGRSKCDACGHVLGWRDLIPVLSFVFLLGKCRYCKVKLSFKYPISEIFTGIIFSLTWYLAVTRALIPVGADVVNYIYLAIAAVLIVMFLADIGYQVIPDEMQISLFIFGLIKLLYLQIVFFHQTAFEVAKITGLSLVYGVAVMAPILLVYIITKGKGMGFGDVKLSFNMGFILGILSGYLALYIGFISGGLFGALMLILKKGKRKTKIAFGPFLILGLYLMLFFESEVTIFLGRIYGF